MLVWAAMFQVLLLLLVVQLPFEFRVPLLSAGRISLSNVELVLYALLAVTAVRAVRSPRIFDGLDWSLLACAGAWITSGLAAPWHYERAILAGGRMACGPLLAILIRQEFHSRERSRLFSLLTATALVSAGLGLLEFLAPAMADGLLNPFRAAPTWSPYGRRAAGSFEHANQLGAFLELALLATFALPTRSWLWLARFGLTLGLLLTLSRSSWLGAVVGSLTAWMLFRHPRSRAVGWSLGSLAAILGVCLVALLIPNVRLRLFGWAVTPPLAVRYAIPPGPPARILMTNMGTMPWNASGANSTMIFLQAINSDGSERSGVHFLDRTVIPGKSWTLTFNPAKIPPGRYRQRYDLWHPVFGYASQWGSPALEGILARTGESMSFSALPGATSGGFDLPTRPQLWIAAWRAFRERPLWGIGPGQFQHHYGRWIPDIRLDPTLHANNLCLGLLAETGFIGLAAFLAILVVAGLLIARQPAAARRSSAAAAGALAAWMAHGLFDTFVHFNGISLAFWLIVATLPPPRKRVAG